MANNYKTDAGKPPLLDALVPFYPALRRLALMMVDAAKAHKLNGAKDPFNEWRQLPDAKRRLANAGVRHMLKGPWKHDDVLVNHPHAALALFNVLASLTLHEEEGYEADAKAEEALGIGVPDFSDSPEQMAQRARELADSLYCKNCSHPLKEHDAGFCYVPGCSCPVRQEVKPVHVPAGADWREKPSRCDSWAFVKSKHHECRRDKGHKGLHESDVGLRW